MRVQFKAYLVRRLAVCAAYISMTEKMDKSLEDIIAEQRTKTKPRVRSGDRTEGATKGSDKRNARPDSRRETKRDVGRKQVAAGPPPREPQYYMVSICLGLLLLFFQCLSVLLLV